LIDQNYYPDAASRYRGLVPSACRCLLGPEFVLLRPEFHEVRKRLRQRDGRVERIHVFYGGADATDETGKALDVLAALNRPELEYDIVVGGPNPNRGRIREACARLPNAAFHCDVRNMAELQHRADLCLGAGGTAAWERASVGLPAITTIIAANQAETTLAAARAGALLCLGTPQDATQERIRGALEDLLEHPWKVRSLSGNAGSLMESTREPAAIVAAAFGL
jgi:UDP-2,4-diacetamido-2,4,6-trideoxy-beta-L-altropyranose hydrolase